MRKSTARAVAGKEAWLREGGRETATSSQRGTSNLEELDFPLKACPVIHGTGSDSLLMLYCSCVLTLYSHAIKLWCGTPVISSGGTLMYVIQICLPPGQRTHTQWHSLKPHPVYQCSVICTLTPLTCAIVSLTYSFGDI